MAYLYFKQLGNNGRLGNQLFQIAATLGIAHANNMTPLFPANWKYRKDFNIPDEYFGECREGYTYKENGFHYSELEIRDTGNIELVGYFQSEKYWHNIKDTVIEYLTPKGAEPGTIDAVSIHHRRGDYVGNKNYQQLGMNYYISAYDSCFKGKEICPFSDDHNYIDLHYKGNTLTAKPTNEIDDLKGIIACKYHICSNSTFSWWGAYLSNRFTVIRPTVYFAGPLSRNDTRDFWPSSWMVWDNHYKIDLNDTTFIIPFSYDHPDRLENINTVSEFIEKHFNTAYIIGEVNTDKLKDDVLDVINQLSSIHNNSLPLRSYYQYKMPAFHRTKVLNDLTRKAETPIVFNFDADAIISPWQIYYAVEKVRNGADVVYPFDGTVANIPRSSLQPLFDTLDCGVFAGKKWPWLNSSYKSVGIAFVYNRESFLNAGGEEEGFISYGGEDQQRYMRFKRLGLKVERVLGTAFHLDHYRGKDSSERHPDAANNRVLFDAELAIYKEWCLKTNDPDTWRPFQSSTGRLCQW